MTQAGLYIVELHNDERMPIDKDRRRINTCIQVTRHNCKFGKTEDLSGREKSYVKIFQPINVTFHPIAYVKDVRTAERLVLKCLDQWRVRGSSKRRRKLEWLEGISPSEVKKIALETLRQFEIQFDVPNPEADSLVAILKDALCLRSIKSVPTSKVSPSPSE